MSAARARVLFILPTLMGGGAERVICTLLRHLDRDQFVATLAVLDMTNAVYRADVPDDIPVVDLQRGRLRQALLAIGRLIWKTRPDLVFSTSGHVNLALAAGRPLLPHKSKFVARETAMISLLQEPGYEAVPVWWHWAYRRFFGALDAVVCQSEEMRSDLVEQLSVPRDRTVVIPNPVDIDAIRQRAAEPVDVGWRAVRDTIELVAAGSLQPRKGFDLLIDALAFAERPDLRLTILGDGPLRQALQSQAVRRGVADRVRFLGFQKNPYPFIAAADAFVLSSRFEGMPNVVLEALACGTPVIALPAPGGVREVLKGMTGCRVATDVSAAALATELRQFVFGHRLPADVVAPYAVADVTRRYEAVLANALHARERRV